MANTNGQRVVHQPQVYRGMQRGINQLVAAIRPTLGPQSGTVAHAKTLGGTPELLDDGGTIARRIVELQCRDEDVGAMYLRSLLWRLHEDVGDGAATAAVLFEAIYNEGIRYIAAGGDAMRLRHHLEKGALLILDQLMSMTIQLEGKEALAQVANSICYDPPLAAMLGEILDIVGEYGHIEIVSGHSRGLEREYQEGMDWSGGLHSREMISDPGERRTRLEDVAILISDLSIGDPHQFVPLLQAAVQTGKRTLVIVAKKLSANSLAVLHANNNPEKFQMIAVKTPGLSVDDHRAALEDFAVLTGGRPLREATGDSLDRIKPEDFGIARRAWATTSRFGLVGGKGDPRQLRTHIRQLQTSLAPEEDAPRRRKLRERIGKLMGGSAVLRVGGLSEGDVEQRKKRAKRTARVLREAIRGGVLPGGGTALIACKPILQNQLEQSSDPEEKAAYRILINSLEAPARTIIANAGYNPGEIMARIGFAGQGHGFDVNTGQVVDMTEANIYDVATIQQATVRSAISGAALALTVDVMIHHKNPEEVMQPR